MYKGQLNGVRILEYANRLLLLNTSRLLAPRCLMVLYWEDVFLSCARVSSLIYGLKQDSTVSCLIKALPKYTPFWN